MARQPRPWYRSERDAWYVQVDGRQVLLARGKESRKEAVAEFHRLMASGGKAGPTSKLSAGDLFELFLDHVDLLVSRGERAPITYEGYCKYLTSADEAFGAVLAVEVRPLHVHRWADDPSRSWGPTTRHAAITAVKAAFRWAKRRGYLATDPVADVEKPTPRRREAIPTAEQAGAILEAAGPELRDLLACLGMTGCRPGELTTLEARSMDHDAGVWHVRDKIRRHTGRGTREVYPPPAALEVGRRLAARWPEGPVFRNARGRPWTRNAMGCGYRRIRAKTGLKGEVVAYALRHAYVTDALEGGLDALTVATLVGHRSTRMIETRYSHLEDRRQHLRDQARRVRPGAVSGPSGPDASGPPGPTPASDPPPPAP
jgi:integrase